MDNTYTSICVGPGPGTKQERYTAASKIKGTPNPLTSAARFEHALVGQSLMEIIGPRLHGEVLLLVLDYSTLFNCVIRHCLLFI